jgi:hypothetical protein
LKPLPVPLSPGIPWRAMSGDFEKGWRGKDDWWLWRKGIYWSGLARGQLDEFEQLWQRRVVMRE